MSRSYKLYKVLCAKLVLFSALPVLAAEIHVTNLDDSGAGSLRQAINFTALPGDTIVFDVPGTITLTSGELVIDKNLRISGPGAESLAISGNLASRVFHITGAAAVSISGVTIRDGNASAIPISPDAGGGGIFIESGTTLTLAYSTLSGNSVLGGSGGGIFNSGGTLTVTNSTLSSNSASYYGGGIFNSGGTLTLTYSTLSGNSSGSGGGIANDFGTLTLTNSTLSGNSTVYGGGIWNQRSMLTVTNSTLSGNSSNSGGGIWNNYSSTLTVRNSTLSGNSATAFGGGILNASGSTVKLTNSTISGNSAYSYYYDGAQLLNFSDSLTLTLKNTIVAKSLTGVNCYAYYGAYRTFTSQGHNLSDDSSCSLGGTGDQNGIPSGLDTAGLKDNGGPTKTIALLEASPAIDAIPISPVNYCAETDGTTPIATDQRGVARPVGPACDIGAFEGSVIQTNQPPVANAGPDQTGVVNLSLTFNGSASSDPDGTLTSYRWDFGDYSTATGATVSHTYSTAGSYTATLTVTDDGGATASDTSQVTIQTPAQSTETLTSAVLSLELSRGIERSLSATLNAALASINHGDQLAKLAAINQLQAFIYQVSALEGVKLTPAEATSLISAAQQIIQSLSSSP